MDITALMATIRREREKFHRGDTVYLKTKYFESSLEKQFTEGQPYSVVKAEPDMERVYLKNDRGKVIPMGTAWVEKKGKK